MNNLNITQGSAGLCYFHKAIDTNIMPIFDGEEFDRKIVQFIFSSSLKDFQIKYPGCRGNTFEKSVLCAVILANKIDFVKHFCNEYTSILNDIIPFFQISPLDLLKKTTPDEYAVQIEVLQELVIAGADVNCTFSGYLESNILERSLKLADVVLATFLISHGARKCYAFTTKNRIHLYKQIFSPAEEVTYKDAKKNFISARAKRMFLCGFTDKNSPISGLTRDILPLILFDRKITRYDKDVVLAKREVREKAKNS